MNSQECPATVEVKSCKDCLQEMPLSAFYQKRKLKSGKMLYMAQCKACFGNRSAESYEKRKDAKLARCAEYRVENRDMVASYLRGYYQRNRDAIIEKTKAYQSQPHRKVVDKARLAKSYADRRGEVRQRQNANNATPEGRERQRQRYLKHYEANKTYYLAKGATRRAQTMQATPPWVLLEHVILFYEEAKRLTELTGVKHVVDHIVPLTSKKVCGLHVPSNLQVIPELDNWRKFNHFDG